MDLVNFETCLLCRTSLEGSLSTVLPDVTETPPAPAVTTHLALGPSHVADRAGGQENKSPLGCLSSCSQAPPGPERTWGAALERPKKA